MIAYHNEPEIKARLLARLADDAKHDRIVHGQYWKNGKGCAVGCTIRGNDHSKYETELGIPQSIARLEDSIFEGLTNGAAQRFPLAFAAAIVPGADLSKVTAQFLVWCLIDKKHGAIRQVPADKFKDCHNAVLTAAALWQTYIKAGVLDTRAARSAARAAASAESAAWSAESAAWSAAESAAWSAARASARSAESAARSAAWSAESAAESAARAARAAQSAAWSTESEFWTAAAATLVKLLKAAPGRSDE